MTVNFQIVGLIRDWQRLARRFDEIQELWRNDTYGNEELQGRRYSLLLAGMAEEMDRIGGELENAGWRWDYRFEVWTLSSEGRNKNDES